ncbi:MAG: SH3 domain-containing protein [Terrisporobacter othiniensis]|uniref:C40 family peptidase n=1 Tax=Terrisporobacter petrolearius TaxID=1460447 RepID=UPI0011DCC7EA|nr:SH3 domain-containing protein [Terrisporobacter othiniensis]MDU6994995.1 SH3 domain-containing protein [Terrisporobacter othiniensis]
MSINKKYVMAGMLATALVAPMADVTNSHADDTRTITGRVNFRTGPSKEYDSMGKIEKGKTVTYLGSNGSWRKIKYNSKTGYVHKDYISSGTSASSSEKYVDTSAGLNVRKGPSTSYAKIATLTNGTKVKVITTSGDWSKISSGSITGYVSNQYLSSKAPSSDNDSNETSITKYVDASVGLNVRKGAGTSYSVITTLSHGTKVTVKSTSNGWSKITSGSVTGYVSSAYLSSNKPSTGNDSNNETSTTKYVDSKPGLNVRRGAGTSYSVITTLNHGTKVTVKSTNNGWSKITSGSVTGYVSSTYLTSTKPSSGGSSDSNTSTSTSASKVISYAKKLLGKPYVWGAQGPSGFDCSGFTYYVFKNAAGITLPRTSSLQSHYGTYVSRSNLKAGDLVFFDTVGSNNGGVTHVGIYIGNGQLIHAASGQGKVVINDMNSSYYVNTYVNARRVL